MRNENPFQRTRDHFHSNRAIFRVSAGSPPEGERLIPDLVADCGKGGVALPACTGWEEGQL